jgi:Polyketide cyclase / dehydrase and lipid transport
VLAGVAGLLLGCGHAELAPRNPEAACRADAPAPIAEAADGFPCWPDGLAPADCPVYVRNEALTPAAPPVVWAWLTRADLWPTWFHRAEDLHVESGGPSLAPGSVVAWKMLGASIRVTVTRSAAPSMLVWEGGANGVHADHAWLLLPAGSGTRIVTVETECGPLPFAARWYLRGALHDAHEDWVTSLAKAALSGPPPPALPGARGPAP